MFRFRVPLFPLAILWLVAGATLVNADDTPPPPPFRTELPAGTRTLFDIPYGSDNAQRMDVYLPAQLAAPAPVLFYVHGGAWVAGDKRQDKYLVTKASHWLEQGYIFISTNHRLLPTTDPLSQVDDVARALANAQQQAPTWGGDASRFILVGYSAGGHLASILSADPARAFRFGAKPWLGMVGLDIAGLDLPTIMQQRHFAYYDKAFGSDKTYWQAASPLAALQDNAVPMLLLCSTKPPDESCQHAQRFAAAAHARKVRVEVLELPLSHREIGSTPGQPSSLTTSMDRFVDALTVAKPK